ncbi:MAG TPA: nicotinate-nucleotide--dimethylbenzimidazole phosphoribosyltransferase, partial [Pseudomonas sp.]|nr:nicotinate-nucleotide--dimethylbenzimidazole phosphoribosyltransferase [Pseudomonas sp.]
MQEWWNEPCRQPDEAARIRAMARQDQLTKPRGALGQLEALAVNLAALQACDRPAVERLHLCVFAGDHG